LAEETDFEIGHFRMDLHDLDLGSSHMAYLMYHSSTSTYTPNFVQIGKHNFTVYQIVFCSTF